MAVSTSDAQYEEAKKKSREAFIVFEHREGSKLVDESTVTRVDGDARCETVSDSSGTTRTWQMQTWRREIPTVIRSLGINPPSSHIRSIMDALKQNAEDDSNFIPLERFEELAAWGLYNNCTTAPAKHSVCGLQQVMSKHLVGNQEALARDDMHRLVQAFQALDPDARGWIDGEYLKQVMMTQGEPMTADEINSMLAFASDYETGRIYYEEYAYRLANDGRSA